MTSRPSKIPHVSLYPVDGRWRLSYKVPGTKRRRTERLGVNRSKAEKRARIVSEQIDSVKSKLMTGADMLAQLEDARPIREHLAAYEKHLRDKGVSEPYVKLTIYRVREALDILGAARIGHLTRAAVEQRLVGALRKRRKPRGDGQPGDESKATLSPQTIHHYLRALKQFTRRMKRMGRIPADPLDGLEGVKIGDPAGKRREATEADVMALIAAARKAKPRKWNEMRGPDRALLYAWAFATGLRLSELRAAKVGWFRPELADILVPGDVTKNGKPANQPLPGWLVKWTQKRLRERQAGKKFAAAWMESVTLFPLMPASLHRMFAKDRQAAGLPYRTDSGVLVFHSLRHGYVSMLANTEAPAKLVQSLARHADIGTTMNRYAHARTSAAAAAVEKALPRDLMRASRKKATVTA